MSQTHTVLALDAAYGPAAACLLLPGSEPLLAETDQNTPHSKSILPLLSGLLEKAGIDWQQLDMLATGAGPGSFTGLRVAAATISGLNAPLGLPVIHVSSLAITALQAGMPKKIRVIEDARSGDAYFGCYQQGEPLQPDQCLSWHEVSLLPAAGFISQTATASELEGWQRIACVHSRAEALAKLVLSHTYQDHFSRLPRHAIPAYMQPSQAEKNAAGG